MRNRRILLDHYIAHIPAYAFFCCMVLPLAAVFLTSCSLDRAAPVQSSALSSSVPNPDPAADSSRASIEAPPPRGGAGTVVSSQVSNQLSPWQYVGETVPEYKVTVIAEVSGIVLQLDLKVGDYVESGDTLVMVERGALEAQRAHALAALEAAQAQVVLLKTEASETEIEAARAAVAAADAAYKQALEGPAREDVLLAETQLRVAEEALQRAQDGSAEYLWDPLTGAAPERPELEQAILALEAAKAHYAKLLESSNPDVIARAYSDLASARAQLQRLEDGAAPAQIQAAEANVRQAETALYLSQLQVDKATIRAPVDGIVSQLSATQGAMIVPGSPVLDLLSPQVQIVIHVEESRLPDLRIGQPAVISVDIFPNRTYIGEIAIIAPEIDPTTGTVSVTIRARDGAGELVPGMVAIVDLAQ